MLNSYSSKVEELILILEIFRVQLPGFEIRNAYIINKE